MKKKSTQKKQKIYRVRGSFLGYKNIIARYLKLYSVMKKKRKRKGNKRKTQKVYGVRGTCLGYENIITGN